MPERGSLPVIGEKAYVQVKLSEDSDWLVLPGPNRYRDGGIRRETSEQRNFKGAASIVGGLVLGEVTIESKYIAWHPAWVKMREAILERKPVDLQVTAVGKKIKVVTGAGNTIAISATGAVTLAGSGKVDFTQEIYDVGMLLETNGKLYVISTINDSTGAVTVVAPGTAVAARADYNVWVPSPRKTWVGGEIIATDGLDLAGEGGTTELVFKPAGVAPPVEAGTYAEM